MYSLELPSGKILDMPSGLQFSFELQNSVFSGSNTSVLPGSFTFPVTLPETGVNAAAFGLPQLPTSAKPLRAIDGVWVLAHGVRMFFGTLKLRKAGGGIEVSITANPISSIKATPLNQLDLGGDRDWGSDDAARQAHMKATALDPDSHDYTFPMVYNDNFFGETPIFAGSRRIYFQNFYENDGFDMACEMIMPMARLDYVLRRLVETTAEGWSLRNDWQNTPELRRIYLYSRYSVWTYPDSVANVPVLPNTINLQHHVSTTKGNEFLKKVVAQFALGLFTNPFSRTISIQPLSRVTTAAARHDWTPFVDGGAVAEYEEASTFDAFCHQAPTDGVDASYGFPDNLDGLPQYQKKTDIPAASSADDGFAYVWPEENIYEVRTQYDASVPGIVTAAYLIGRKRLCQVLGNVATFTSKLGFPVVDFLTKLLTIFYYSIRMTKPGSYVQETDTPGVWERTKADQEDTVFFYRGIQRYLSSLSGSEIPYASIGNHDGQGNEPADITTSGSVEATAEHSMLWTGQHGLYEKYHKAWRDITANGKPITYNLLLPLHELTSFRFQHKVRILNMDYFVVKLRVKKLTADRKFVVEASLFSVI